MIDVVTQLASEDEVKRMRVAASGLTSHQVKNTLDVRAIPAARGLRSIPNARVYEACQALRVAVRGDIRTPVAPHIGGHSGLEHGDCLDGWPVAQAVDLRRLREAADGLFGDQIRAALGAAGVDPGWGLDGVAPADAERVCAALSAHPRLGKAA